MDLNGKEAAVSGGTLCSSNEADDAALIGDQVNEESEGGTNEQRNEGHGKDVAGGPDNIGEARHLGCRTILDAPPGAKLRNTCCVTGHTGLGANIAFVEGLPQVLIGGERQRRGSLARIEFQQGV